MASQALETLYQFRLRQHRKLVEVDGLTRELADTLGRGDQISAQMVLSMRQEPLSQVEHMENAVRAFLLTLPEEEAIRCAELLKGAPPVSEEEQLLCRQIAQNQRLLEKIAELDQRVSLRLGGRHSFYRKFR